MTVPFWKRETRTPEQVASDTGPGPVSDQHALPITPFWKSDGATEYEEAGEGHPSPFYTPAGYSNRTTDDDSALYWEGYAHEALSVGTTAVGFTLNTYGPGGSVLIADVTVEVAPIRISTDFTVPTSTVGTPYPVGSVFRVSGLKDITKFRAISSSGGTATLTTQYSRRAL